MSFQREFEGYSLTPYLFQSDQDLPFDTFLEELISTTPFKREFNRKIRLGSRVEQYVFHQLNDCGFKTTIENLQIISDKKTIGELDCIVEKGNQHTHIEIVYKFYLYDGNTGKSEMEHWIGPNKKDSLSQKIKKLQMHQLPLLNNPNTHKTLQSKKIIKANNQKVLFKAQLFVPYIGTEVRFKIINKNCVFGYHLSKDKIDLLRDKLFYVPAKSEWIMRPVNEVNWMSFASFKNIIDDLHLDKKSPLCWMKSKKEIIEKIFITWW